MLKNDALKDKVIIVTGGGSGLGKAMTKYFLQLGAKVVITSRNLEKLQNTAKELEEETGGTVFCVSCDVRNWDEVEAMKEATLKEFGKIDVLLNNAAGNFISPTERLTHSAFDSVLDIVLKGTKNCTLSVGKHWIDSKTHGTVLNIVTTYSWTGSAYGAVSMCKSRCFGYDEKSCCRVGKIWNTFQCYCSGTIPYKGSMGKIIAGRSCREI